MRGRRRKRARITASTLLDGQTLHNPDVAFSAADLPRSIVPPGVDVGAREHADANPWVRERAAEPAAELGNPGAGDPSIGGDSGASTLFMPKADEGENEKDPVRFRAPGG